ETLLAPAAAHELALWQRIERESGEIDRKAITTARKQVEAIDAESRALAERWLKAGSATASRAEWERQATALMLRLDVLRTQRLERAPGSEAWQGGYDGISHHRAAGSPVPAAMPSPSPMAEAVLADAPPPPSPPS